jgi:cell division protein ZipA
MEADQLRLILLGLGLLLILGIYLWDRLTRKPRPHARVTTVERRPPQLRADAEEPAVAEESGETWTPPDTAPLPEQSWEAVGVDDEPELTGDLSFDAHGGRDYLHETPDFAALPSLILQLNLARPTGDIGGVALAEAMAKVDMFAGDMAIYHRYDAQQTSQVLFSCASLVEPGSFPVDDMAAFHTPGVTLFTRLPGLRDGLAIFSDMLFTAERLAAMLDAEVQDESHNPLTKQWVEHKREAILEHRRQLHLARSKG